MNWPAKSKDMAHNIPYEACQIPESTVYPNKYAHCFVVLCFVVVMQSFIMNSHEVFIHIHQGCFAGTGAIVRLPQCQWSKPDGYGKISQCITTTKHSKAVTVCIFLRIYCMNSREICLAMIYPCIRWPSQMSALLLGPVAKRETLSRWRAVLPWLQSQLCAVLLWPVYRRKLRMGRILRFWTCRHKLSILF